jgi:hypothetical protein
LVALNWDILSLFDVVDALEDRQTVTNTGNAHALEIVVQQGNQGLSNNVVFCKQAPAIS